MDPAIRVIVADDHPLFRRFLARLLTAHGRFRVIGEAADGEEALVMTKRLSPDLLLADERMPKLRGTELAREVARKVPSTRVVILTGFVESGPAIEAVSGGVAGYIVKDVDPETLVHSLLAVVGDERVIAACVVAPVMKILSGAQLGGAFHDGLSEREIEVLRLEATGLANKEVARALDIAEKTVRNHVAHIHAKLGIHDRSQAVLYAVRNGLVTLS